jgi:hypothetical protein
MFSYLNLIIAPMTFFPALLSMIRQLEERYSYLLWDLGKGGFNVILISSFSPGCMEKVLFETITQTA